MNKHNNEKNEYKEIYLKYLDNLYWVALSMTQDQVDAEDLVEDTFLRAFSFFHKYKRGTNIKAWLFKIMHNLFINKYRKKKKEPQILELKEEISELYIPPDFFSKFLDTEIQKAIESLPEEFKKVIILSDLEGFNYQELSRILNCALGTVRSRLSRGRKLLYYKLYDYAKRQGYIIS